MLNLSQKKLDVYLISLKLLEQVYVVTKLFPADERFLLVSQLRRASISVCSNIAEGHQGRQNQIRGGFWRFQEVH